MEKLLRLKNLINLFTKIFFSKKQFNFNKKKFDLFSYNFEELKKLKLTKKVIIKLFNFC